VALSDNFSEFPRRIAVKWIFSDNNRLSRAKISSALDLHYLFHPAISGPSRIIFAVFSKLRVTYFWLSQDFCPRPRSSSDSARRASPDATRLFEIQFLQFSTPLVDCISVESGGLLADIITLILDLSCALSINTGHPLEKRPMRWARRIRLVLQMQTWESDGAKSLSTSFDHNGCRKEFMFSCLLRDFSSWSSPSDSKAINSTNSFCASPIIDAKEVC
jgi:hypothetical protein